MINKRYTIHEFDNCPDCGTKCSGEEVRCINCGFNFVEDESTESESSLGIDPYDY